RVDPAPALPWPAVCAVAHRQSTVLRSATRTAGRECPHVIYAIARTAPREPIAHRRRPHARAARPPGGRVCDARTASVTEQAIQVSAGGHTRPTVGIVAFESGSTTGATHDHRERPCFRDRQGVDAVEHVSGAGR